MWTARRREAEIQHENKTRDRLRRLVAIEAAVMAGDPGEVETRLRKMQYGHRVRK